MNKKGQKSIHKSELRFCIEGNCQITPKCYISNKKDPQHHLNENHKVVDIDYFDGYNDGIRDLLTQIDKEKEQMEHRFIFLSQKLNQLYIQTLQNELSNKQRAMRLLCERKLGLITDGKVRDGFQQLKLENLKFLKSNAQQHMKDQLSQYQAVRQEFDELLNQFDNLIDQFKERFETQTQFEAEQHVYFIFNRSILGSKKLPSTHTIEKAINLFLQTNNILIVPEETNIIIAPMYTKEISYQVLKSSVDLQQTLGGFLGQLAIYVEQPQDQIGSSLKLNQPKSQLGEGFQNDILVFHQQLDDQLEKKQSEYINSDVQQPPSAQYGVNQTKSQLLQEEVIQQQIPQINQQTQDADQTVELEA